MDVQVECYSGHRGEETPRRFQIGGRRVEVVEVIDRWRLARYGHQRYCSYTGK